MTVRLKHIITASRPIVNILKTSAARSTFQARRRLVPLVTVPRHQEGARSLLLGSEKIDNESKNKNRDQSEEKWISHHGTAVVVSRVGHGAHRHRSGSTAASSHAASRRSQPSTSPSVCTRTGWGPSCRAVPTRS